MTKCAECKIEKPLTDFRKTNKSKDTFRTECKECEAKYRKLTRDKRENKYNYNKNHHLKNKYGITKEDYLKLLENQGGVCAICGTSNTGKRKALSVDHDHQTGKIRGLLCSRCNSGLGNLRDDIEIIEKAIKYLEKYESL